MSRRTAPHALPDELRSEGGLLSADFLARLGQPSRRDKSISGLLPADYHLADRDTLADGMTRAWNELRGHWQGFATRLAKDPDAASRPKVVLDHWLLPLFQTLGYGRLAPADKDTTHLGEVHFPISYLWHKVPIHLVPWSQDLDRPTATTGRHRRSPHGLLQDFLNKSDKHLWGFVSNGRVLRILRDHRSLTRAAYVELDLEAMFTGDAFHAFRWLWLLVHESRVDADTPEQFRLEAWFKEASDEGVRALESLRAGVTSALEVFANGFFRHPANGALRAALTGDNPKLPLAGYYRELLRLAYRLIFVFVAEDRGALLDPNAAPAARSRFERFYATRRLRERALNARARSADPHDDLYDALALVLEKLDRGEPRLGLPALGSLLFRASSTPHLSGVRLANADLLAALSALSTTRDAKGLRYPVSWRLVGAEELGSIYESLLELHLAFTPDGAALTLQSAAGHARKTTGSYYTPSSLVECLLDTALDPVVDQAIAGKNATDAESAILALSVVDPAVGSGHFLLTAGRRLAKRLAQVRTGENEPSLQDLRHAMRDVVGRCLYGVDLNDMAAELCKVGLWLEAIEPGRPLSFLDAHIQVGNSLLGTTPELIAKSVPDAAWQELTGDDKEVVKALKRRNKQGGTGQLGLGLDAKLTPSLVSPALVQAARGVEAMPDQGVADIDAKEAAWSALLGSADHRNKTLLADVWCAAFVWPKQVGDLNDAAPVAGLFSRFAGNPEGLPEVTRRVAHELAERYQFFHWHLRFPAVMERGGFDVVLGNPPWERVKLQEKEWFAERAPKIAAAENAAARKKLIEALPETDPELWAAWQTDSRMADGESHLIRSSERYPLCAVGDINTYAIFAELDRSMVGPHGRLGIIVPTGIATDDTTKRFFDSITTTGELRSLYDFQSGPGLFAEVGHARFKFALLTLARGSQELPADFAFFLREVSAGTIATARFRLSGADISLLNPNTKTCPIFRSARDSDITKAIYRRVPVLWRESDDANPWGIRFLAMFHMANDSDLFEKPKTLQEATLEGNIYSLGASRWLPLYEAKMVHHFDHRYGDYRDKPGGSESTSLPEVPVAQLEDPKYTVHPRYWVAESAVEERLKDRWTPGWLLGWRDVCRSSDERTMVCAVIPRVAVGHKLPLMFPQHEIAWRILPVLSSLVFDFVCRQKMGGTSLTYFIVKQLPVLPPTTFDAPCPWSPAESLGDWIRPRVLELTYTAWDMQPFAKDLGFDGPPFKWDDTRRRHLRAELDAAFFHLYGLTRDEAAYVLDTFPIVRRDDEARFGTYLTKDLILAAYDQYAAATATMVAPAIAIQPPPAPPAAAPRTPAKTTAKKSWRVMEYKADSGAIIGWGLLTQGQYAKWKKHPRSDRQVVSGYFVVANMESLAEHGQVPCDRLLDYFHVVDALPERGVSVNDMEATFTATDDHPARGDE